MIHSESWKASHASFCGADFVGLHTPERQEQFLRGELMAGKHIYMLIKDCPVGIVSVYGGLIENLYVLPSQQRKGYGTELPLFAVSKCEKPPRLCILESNRAAYSLYTKYGFRLTGQTHVLSDTLSEIEMRYNG